MNNIIKAFINLGKRCNLCKKKKNVNALCILFDLVVKAYFTLKFSSNIYILFCISFISINENHV